MTLAPAEPPTGAAPNRPLARAGFVFSRLIEPPAAVPARWRGWLRLLTAVLLPLMGLSLLTGLTLGAMAVAGDRSNLAPLVSALGAFFLIALAYGLARIGRYLPAALLTVAVILLGILAPAAAGGIQANTLAYLTIPIVLGGLLLPPRYAGGLAVFIFGLTWVLHAPLIDGPPLALFYVLILVASVSVLVVIGAAIHDRDAAHIEAQARALHDTNAQLTGWLADMEQRSSEMVVLNELGEMLQACTTPVEAFQIVAEAARQLYPGQAGAVCLQTASRTNVETMAEWGPSTWGARVFAPDDCGALRRGRAHTSPPNDPGRRCRHLAGPDETRAAHLCLPLTAQGESLGLLHLTLPGVGDAADPGRRLAQTLTDNMALAMANLKLRETLRSQSIRDVLTGLFNRRYLEETMERELRRAERANRPRGLIMLDIDHFKLFNDTYGHGAGDAALKKLGDYLLRQVRGGDIACRLGGEEFVIILPEAPLSVVRERAAALQAGLRHLTITYGGQVLGPVAISAGIAMFSEHGATREALLKAADSALYQAKREGRDRVVVYA